MVWTYVDSGAALTILAEREAKRLGIDIGHGAKTMVIVGDGGLIPVYMFHMHTRVGEVEFSAPIGFSPNLGVGFIYLAGKVSSITSAFVSMIRRTRSRSQRKYILDHHACRHSEKTNARMEPALEGPTGTQEELIEFSHRNFKVLC